MIFQDAASFNASGFKPKVFVIGSGPAGMTVARKLARSGVPCAIIEAGGDDWSEESQDFYKGKVVGDQYFELDATRLRFLGGSSNHWAGWCRVLEDYDFEAKDYVPQTGWPIKKADLAPYFPEAFEELGIPGFEPDRKATADFRTFQVYKSDPVRFGPKFRDELDASKLVAVLLNTHVTELVGDGKAITAAKIRSNGVDAGSLKAPYFVLATGGLENSRLLLWSNQRSNGGVVPNAKSLGRYWMEHPMYWSGNALITNAAAIPFDFEGDVFFMPSKEAMARRGTLNFHIRIETTPFHGVKGFVADLACNAPDTAEWVAGMLGSHLQCSSRVHVDWEQAPRFDNHIALSSTELDKDGIPRMELHWKKDELDRHTQLEGLRMFGENLAKSNLGRLHISDWVRDGGEWPTDMELAGNHHMGGTRMAADPQFGVVDANCRVHGMSNLYIGGSSVFATSGQCTPTTTITTLAMRLGDHLAKVVNGQQAQGLRLETAG